MRKPEKSGCGPRTIPPFSYVKSSLTEYRLLKMPCCKQLVNWIEPWRPQFCPACGKTIPRKIDIVFPALHGPADLLFYFGRITYYLNAQHEFVLGALR